VPLQSCHTRLLAQKLGLIEMPVDVANLKSNAEPGQLLDAAYAVRYPSSPAVEFSYQDGVKAPLAGIAHELIELRTTGLGTAPAPVDIFALTTQQLGW
jgi:hypothetical protein